MKRSFALKKNRDFHYTYRAGKSYGGRFAVLIVARGRQGSVLVGFSVSKKVGNAVVRNRVKRRMKEAIRLYLPQIKKGHNLVFVARPNSAQQDFSSLRFCLEQLLRKSNLLVPACE